MKLKLSAKEGEIRRNGGEIGRSGDEIGRSGGEIKYSCSFITSASIRVIRRIRHVQSDLLP